MLCLVLLVFALSERCRGDSNNSSTSPVLLLPPVPASRRMSAAQVDSLRRQLMRDNYDYQHSGDERQPNITARSGGDMKFYYQKGGTNPLPQASEVAQANSNAFSAESGQQQHYRPHGQYEQRGQHQQGRQHDQPGEYEHRGQYAQPSEHDQRGQYQQPDEHEQRGQYDHRDQYEQHGPHKQRGQHKHHEHHEERDQHGKNEQRAPHEQRGQNEQREQSEQQEQLRQFDEQEQIQSIEQKPHASPPLDDTPVALPVAVPFTDKLTVRDVFKRENIPDQRDIEPEQAKEYNPSYYNKRHDAYDPTYPAQMERRPFSDLRGNYKEQYGQNDADNDMLAQEELASNARESPDQEYTPEEQEAFDQQDASGSQDDEGSDFSVSRIQPKIHNEFITGSTTRANRLQYYTSAPAERNEPAHRVHNSLSYHDHNSPLHRNRNEPVPHSNAPLRHGNAQPPQRNAPPPHSNAPDHNISKKDLLYYMDDSQLRRRNNDASPDVPDEDQPADYKLPSAKPSPGPKKPAGSRTNPHERLPAPTEGRSGGELPRTTRARRSFVVTVSAGNVTYKLLTLKSRSGRRQDERRILEERGPAGVAIMSLDHAPLPAFRLPQARRQYMHAPHHHRHREPA